eukprot:s6562_g7.t1
MFYGAGHTVAAFLAFFNSFEWPHGLRAHRKEVLQIFETKIPLGDFKCSASQGLSIYPMVRIFVLVHAVSLAEATVRQACNSKEFDTNHELEEDLPNKGKAISAPELRTRIRAHCEEFLKAHSEDAVIPKFHYALHLPGMLHRHQRLVSCCCHERKHKQIKVIADNLRKVTNTFEHTVMVDVLGKSFFSLQEYKLWTKPSLMKAKPASDQLVAELVTAFGVAQAFGSMVGLVADFQPGQTRERGDTVLVETIELTITEAFLDKHEAILSSIGGLADKLKADIRASKKASNECNAILIEGMIYNGLEQKVKLNRDKILKA